MRHWATFTACMLSGLLTLRAVAAAEGYTPPDDWRQLVPATTAKLNTPKPTLVKLDNGVRLLLLEDHDLPRINMLVTFAAGRYFDKANQLGLASMTGAAWRSGGLKNTPSETLDPILAQLAISMNAWYADQQAGIRMSTPVANMRTGVVGVLKFLGSPRFAQDEVDLQRALLRRAIHQRNRFPAQVAAREFRKHIFGPRSVQARHTEFKTIDALDRNQVLDFHAAWAQPDTMIVGIWGDFYIPKVKPYLVDKFGALEPANIKLPDFPKETMAEAGTYTASIPEAPRAIIMMGAPLSVTQQHPDFPALAVLDKVLSSGQTGRLPQLVAGYERTAIAARFSIRYNSKLKSMFSVALETNHELVPAIIKDIQAEFNRLRTAGITPDELKRAKQTLLASRVFSTDTPEKIIANAMRYLRYSYPSDAMERQAEAVAKVTLEDVKRIAAAYLRTDITVIAGDIPRILNAAPLAVKGKIDLTLPEDPAVKNQKEINARIKAGRALLTKALEHAGGREKLQGVKALQIGLLPKNKQDPNRITLTWQYPNLYRVDARREGYPGRLVQIVNNNRGEQKISDAEPQKITSDVRNMLKAEFGSFELVILKHFAERPNAMEIFALDSEQIAKFKAVMVSGPGLPRSLLLFDKKTEALVQIRTELPNGQIKEVAVGNYRSYDDVQCYTSYTVAEKWTTFLTYKINPELKKNTFYVHKSID